MPSVICLQLRCDERFTLIVQHNCSILKFTPTVSSSIKLLLQTCSPLLQRYLKQGYISKGSQSASNVFHITKPNYTSFIIVLAWLLSRRPSLFAGFDCILVFFLCPKLRICGISFDYLRVFFTFYLKNMNFSLNRTPLLSVALVFAGLSMNGTSANDEGCLYIVCKATCLKLLW